ncbi:MAG TPA: NUDIX domain-containing protein [Acidimicrobiia bacterium]|nr:NUDIX domain-containing protein [Acidimicrobiia bacterium]
MTDVDGTDADDRRIEVAVGAIVRRGDALLLVQRGRGPGTGRWSVPGGRIGVGERLTDAVVREVREETGLEVAVDGFAGWTERIGTDPFPHHYVILDFFATALDEGAAPVADDDARDARFVAITDLGTYPLVDGLAQFLAGVGIPVPG